MVNVQRTSARRNGRTATAAQEDLQPGVPSVFRGTEAIFATLESLLQEASRLQTELRGPSLSGERAVQGRKLAHDLSNVLMAGRCLQQIAAGPLDRATGDALAGSLLELQRTVQRAQDCAQRLFGGTAAPNVLESVVS